MNLFIKLKALYFPLFTLLLAIGIIYGLISILTSTKGVTYAANNSYSSIKQKGVLGAQIGSYNSQLGGYVEYEYCGSDLNTCTSTRNGNYLSYGQSNLHNCFNNQCVIQDIGYGRCGYCVRKPVDCGSLSTNQCNDHLDECFIYRGGKGDAQRCQSKQDVGQTCYTGACYSSPGQYCIPGAKTAGPDAGMIGYCGKNQQGLGEPCFQKEHCESGYCNVSLDVCENPPATPPASSESCKTHADCPANQYCVSNIKGQKGSSSCVGSRVGGENAICEDYASQGLPVNAVCASQKCNTYTLKCEAPLASGESCKTHADCPANQYCISNIKGQKGSSSCVSSSQGGTNAICEDYASQGLPVNAVCASQKCNTSTLMCDAAAGATPAPNPADPDSCTSVDNNDHAFACQASCSGDYSQPYTKTPYNKCSTGQCCYNPAKYPRSQIGNPSGGSTGGGSTTPAPGGGTTSPGGGTTSPGGGTPGPTSGPCQGVKGGVLSYVNGTCNEKLFDATKATAREFCGGVYKDKYICQNIDPATSQRYVDYIPSGGNTCSEAPWCPSASTTTTPTPGPDANCTAYQNQTCRVKSDGTPDYSVSTACCEPNKNFECVKPNPAGGFVCQYKGGAPFTPTPGTAGNCSAANFGRWGAGCPCPVGGGCGTGVGCYREASGKTFPPDNSNGQFCAAGRWCAQSQTDVPNTAACLGSTPYSTPTPTSGGGASDGADCPYYNSDGSFSNNECHDGTTCLPGYTKNTKVGPGGTTGDHICSVTNGRANVCCTKIPGGTGGTTTTPAPGGGTTPPPATLPPASTYTPPSSCTGHPANSMCGSASEANTQCFYPGGTGYWGWKGVGNGCDISSGTQTNCYVCTP